jgi:hypothetical protein
MVGKDILTFIVGMTNALAWPASIVIIAAMLRKRVLEMLSRMSTLKYGDTELSFGSELAKAQTNAVEMGVTTFRPANNFAPGLLQLASTSPTGAVIEGWKQIESELLRLWASIPSDASYQAARAIGALESRGLLNPGLAVILHQLRTTRNKAVHDLTGQVTEGEAIEFLMLSRSVTARLQQLESDRPSQ